jgi:hypothetical protein
MYGVRPFVALLQNKHNLIFKCFFCCFSGITYFNVIKKYFLTFSVRKACALVVLKESITQLALGTGRKLFLCMLFVYIYAYRCPTRFFPYQMMLVSFNRNMMGVTCGTGTASNSGVTPVLIGVSYCSI